MHNDPLTGVPFISYSAEMADKIARDAQENLVMILKNVCDDTPKLPDDWSIDEDPEMEANHGLNAVARDLVEAIDVKPTKLRDGWGIVELPDMEAVHGLDAEQELLDVLKADYPQLFKPAQSTQAREWNGSSLGLVPEPKPYDISGDRLERLDAAIEKLKRLIANTPKRIEPTEHVGFKTTILKGRGQDMVENLGADGGHYDPNQKLYTMEDIREMAKNLPKPPEMAKILTSVQPPVAIELIDMWSTPFSIRPRPQSVVNQSTPEN